MYACACVSALFCCDVVVSRSADLIRRTIGGTQGTRQQNSTGCPRIHLHCRRCGRECLAAMWARFHNVHQRRFDAVCQVQRHQLLFGRVPTRRLGSPQGCVQKGLSERPCVSRAVHQPALAWINVRPSNLAGRMDAISIDPPLYRSVPPCGSWSRSV